MSETPARTPGDRIIVGVDGSDNAKQALREGARLAQALGAPLEVVLCWQDPVQFYEGYYGYWEVDPQQFQAEHQRVLEATITEVFGDYPPDYLSWRLVPGRAAEQLIGESENAQMLVIGRRGRGGVLGMVLGSVSSSLVAHAHCAVLVVRD